MTKTMAVPAIALGCLVSDGGGIHADFVVAEFDRRERIEIGRTADEVGQRRLDTDDRGLVEHAQSQGNWDRADIETVRLAPDVFRSLSADVVADLTRRRCVIPQPWLATEPANVVHGRFTVPDRTDAAVLCSKDRVSSILRVPWEFDGPCGRVGAHSRPRLSAGRGPWPDRFLACDRGCRCGARSTWGASHDGPDPRNGCRRDRGLLPRKGLEHLVLARWDVAPAGGVGLRSCRSCPITGDACPVDR